MKRNSTIFVTNNKKLFLNNKDYYWVNKYFLEKKFDECFDDGIKFSEGNKSLKAIPVLISICVSILIALITCEIFIKKGLITTILRITLGSIAGLCLIFIMIILINNKKRKSTNNISLIRSKCSKNKIKEIAKLFADDREDLYVSVDVDPSIDKCKNNK